MYDSIAFASADSLGPKSAAALIADDDRHFAAISASLARSIADVSARLDAARKAEADMGQEVMERDFEVHRLAGRLRSLRRYGLDLCLGHTLSADGRTYRYIGRTGLLDEAGNELLIDWRSPAAEPFFGATHARPMGISRRRRYLWTNGRISDYWDEVFDVDQLAATEVGDAFRRAALDDQSAFIASLGSVRSPRMRDVLGTIQADQDAIIRAGSRGTLIVDGGPGTGKTIVALHRTAYLLYSDPRLHQRRGGVLFVGPHEPYLGYVADVLPSLGEEGVHTCTLRDLVVEGAGAVQESDPVVAALKSSTHMVEAIDAAVEFYEQPPTKGMVVETEWADLWLGPEDWTEAFDAPEPGTPHNEAREDIRRMLVTILLEKYDGDVSQTVLRESLMRLYELTEALDGAWTLIEAADLVGDLWSVPAYLRKCASWLTTEQVRRLQRTNPIRWTDSDLPLLDAARQRLGDPGWSRRMSLREAAVTAERARMDRVVDELLQGPDEDGMIAQLRQEGIRDALVDISALPADMKDALADPFAHIVVDEAQELTDAEWLMLLRRCPSRSFTIVGDRAQARHGFTENWRERLHRVGFDRIEISSLTVNYRTPEEVMAVAEPVIRAAIPDANVPTSIRSSGIPVRYGCVADLLPIVDTWLAENPDGTGCVVGESAFQPTARMRSLTPELTKGLEFDLVVLVDPARFGPGVDGAVDQYVAMTRATRQLVVLTNP